MPLLERHRLPIEHPDYLYPRSKNPYSDCLEDLKGVVFCDQDTEGHSKKWRSLFPDYTLETEKPTQTASQKRELHVEIGCNAGHVILEWAKKNPKNAYIGIDWKFKPIFRAAEKASKRGIQNLLFFRSHAERIPYCFGPKEIDALYLFFPDPWPKQSHWKHRFVTAERLKKISKLLKPSGIFYIKTDHRGYFDWILEAARECPKHWKILEISMNLHKDHPNPTSLQIPDVTLFEKLFIKDGLPIHSLKLGIS